MRRFSEWVSEWARVCAFVEQLCLLINMFMLNLLGNSAFYFSLSLALSSLVFLFSRSFVRFLCNCVLGMVMYEAPNDACLRRWRRIWNARSGLSLWSCAHMARDTCDDNCCSREQTMVDVCCWLHRQRYSWVEPQSRSHRIWVFTVPSYDIVKYIKFTFVFTLAPERLHTLKSFHSWASNER